MREILFRGKRKDNGRWIFGGVLQKMESNYTAICVYSDYHGWHEFVEVIPETVGEYTGLTDKNGKKIFEGDIINIEYPMTTIKCAVVEYVGSAFVGSTDCDAWDLDNYYALEVIGNIHDNPELLKGE